MWEIRQPDDDAAKESPADLRHDVHRDLGPVESSDRCQRDRHGRIQVRATDAVHTVDCDRNAERPARGDDYPAGVVTLRPLQHDVGDYAVAEDDEDRSSENLSQDWRHGDL